MNINQSKDGEARMDLKVRFRIDLNDVVNSIILAITNEWDFSDKPNKAMAVETALKYYSSMDKILKDVESAHWQHGTALWARVEGCASQEVLDQIAEQARVLVLKKFPAFKSKPQSIQTERQTQ